MDKVGPMARNVRDCVLVLEIIGRPDAGDPDTEARPFDAEPEWAPENVTIRFAKSAFRGRLAEFPASLAKMFEARGFQIDESDFVFPSPAPRARLMLDVEAAAAFDDLMREGALRTLTAQGPRAWPRSMRAAHFVSGVDYVQSARERHELKVATHDAMSPGDGPLVVITPSFAGNALLVTNLTGHPCVCLPAEFIEANGHRQPQSLSFIGRPFEERALCRAAEVFQEVTDHHRQRPF